MTCTHYSWLLAPEEKETFMFRRLSGWFTTEVSPHKSRNVAISSGAGMDVAHVPSASRSSVYHAAAVRIQITVTTMVSAQRSAAELPWRAVKCSLQSETNEI